MIGVVLFCFAINDWEPRLRRQINRLHTSGLYDGADELYLLITDMENKNTDIIKEILSPYPKIQLELHTRNQYEFYALSKVNDLCNNNDDYKVLYFHTKGVFNKFKVYGIDDIDTLKVDGANCWVEMMEYFLVDNWKKCVEKLDEHDTVGVTNNLNWWWGNFWWTKSSHVRKIIPFKDYYGGSRWSCESWLHDAYRGDEPIKTYEFYKFFYDPHYTVIPKYFYNGEDISNIEINVINANFGYFAEQRDEGRGRYYEEDIIVDVTDEIKNSVESSNKKIIFNDWSKYDLHEIFKERINKELTYGTPMTLRIKFSTNFDMEKEYVVSFQKYHNTKIGYLG